MKDVEDRLDLRIEADFAGVRMPDGGTILFTRSERRLLKLMTGQPNRLFTRDEILDAVTEPGSDRTDRNVDFLITRLRRKLSDNARSPRFIATRYGEGYLWVGDVPLSEPDAAGADLVVNAIVGADLLGSPRDGEDFAREVARALGDAMGPDRRVVFAPDCPPPGRFGANAPAQSADLAFFRDRGEISCVVTVREFRTGRPLAARRVSFPQLSGRRAAAERLTRGLTDELWRISAMQPVPGGPLAVSLYSATEGENIMPQRDGSPSNRKMVRLYEGAESRALGVWLTNERRLRNLLEGDPGNSELKLLLAVTLHSKYVMSGQRLYLDGQYELERDEDEIETLVIEALPYVRSNPEHAIVAGKLLHFLRRGYDDLARALCEEAHATTVAMASSLVTIGQMRAFFGETEAGLDLIEQALNLCRPGTHAHAYAIILKGQTLAAAGRWDALRPVRKELYAASPMAGAMLEPLLSHPDKPSLGARAVMQLLSRQRIEATLINTANISARLFRDPAHGANSISGMVRLAANRFGPEAVPAPIRAAYPQLLPANP